MKFCGALPLSPSWWCVVIQIEIMSLSTIAFILTTSVVMMPAAVTVFAHLCCQQQVTGHERYHQDKVAIHQMRKKQLLAQGD
jgi:uncharacterized membrane protein YhaH (DUF805 family)